MPTSAPAKRPYEMKARKEATEATRARILESMYALVPVCSYDELTLQRVADHAGVTFQTVLRHFGTKDGLIAAAAVEGTAQESERRDARAGDTADIARVLCARYEEVADGSANWEALEDRVPVIRDGLRKARESHGQWLNEKFATELMSLDARQRRHTVAALYAATDINTWRLWKKLGLGSSEAERVMSSLLGSIVESLQFAPANRPRRERSRLK